MAEKVVHKVKKAIPQEKEGKAAVTDEQLVNELSYLLSRKAIVALRDEGTINDEEFVQIEQRNRDTFHPYLVELFPVKS